MSTDILPSSKVLLPASGLLNFSGFDLEGTLDAEELSKEFAANGRVLVPRILPSDCAMALSEMLAAECEWGLSLEAGCAGRRFLHASVRRGLSQLQLREIFDAAYSDGGRHFSHLYENISLANYHDKRSRPGVLYTRFLEFVNSDTFLQFARTVSGIDALRVATAVACRYWRGHFYAAHVDQNGGQGHRASFVFNLTPAWEPQWGGLLQFRGKKGDVEEAYLPRFNSLSLFLASQPHSVSLVSAWAPHPRLSIAGALSV